MKRNEIWIRDPFAYVEDDTLYLIGTTELKSVNLSHRGFLGYKSIDMENFDGPYLLFEANDDFWADKDFWAPELHKIDGKYYMFASFKADNRHRASQVLVCDSPLGKYIPLKTPFTPSDMECLDGTFYQEDGVKYTVFCHEWLQCEDGEMVYAPLTDDLCGLKESPKVMFKATDAPWVRRFEDFKEKTGYITDGPFLYKLKSGKLLMIWSSFGEKGYALGMAISENGINGKWTHVKDPLFAENGGHGMIFTFKSKLYLSLHAPNSPNGMERPHFFEIYEVDDGVKLK